MPRIPMKNPCKSLPNCPPPRQMPVSSAASLDARLDYFKNSAVPKDLSSLETITEFSDNCHLYLNADGNPAAINANIFLTAQTKFKVDGGLIE